MVQTGTQSEFAPPTVLDVAGEQVARMYAKALIGATEAAGSTAATIGELDAVVREAIIPNPKFEKLIGSDAVSHEDKVQILDRVFQGKISPLLLNFMKVLSSHGRLANLRAIHREARFTYDEMQGRKHVQVRSAHALSAAASEQIKRTLRPMISAEPVLDFELDPSLIGGVVIRVGDTVFDGSVATRLEQMRKQMIDRSIHEIQRGRNRFSHPAGD